MLKRIVNNPRVRWAAKALQPGSSLQLGGVWGSSAALLAGAIQRRAKQPMLFVTTHLDDADELTDDLELFSGKSVQLFPAWEAGISAEHISEEVAGERMRICALLSEPPEFRDASVDIIVAPVMALLQPVPTKDTLSAAKLTLHRGQEYGPEKLAEWLVDSDFESVEQVDQPNEFARRGGIVDVFPTGAGQAIRIEFFGDEIDSIRRFDLDTQRSTEQIDAIDITASQAGRQVDPGRTTYLSDYLPEDTIITMVEPAEVHQLAGDLYRRIHSTIHDKRKLHEAGHEVAAEAECLAVGLFQPHDVFSRLEQFAHVEMHTFGVKGDAQQTVDLEIKSLQKLSFNTHEALTELSQLSEVCEVWVYCENPAEQDRFTQMLQSSHPGLAERINLSIGHVRSGFHWPGEKLVLVGHHEIFRRYAKVRKIRRVRTGRPIDSLLDLQAGDYVVHVSHGIAKFEGLRHIEREGVNEEYLRLLFADNAVLHVPASQINLVQKYIGSGARRPTLSKLGGTHWSRQKNRVMEAVRDMAAEMIRTQAMRKAIPGVSYPTITDLQEKFVNEFLYTETEDQITAMQQIDADMALSQPMDRLLCGDVGYGKTELAMRAAFRVVEAGKQVAVLVPTTVLADQHYRTFKERCADFPVNVDVISRFRAPGDTGRLLRELAEGKIDILIGTHRMLSDDVRFGDLGLVVIDEEQRFGVEHKEKLKRMRASVDVLTLTATPIPRTLHMSLLGLRDISSLTTPPMDRRSIHTEVCHHDDDLVRAAIVRELNRGGQVFYVHNRVGNILSVAAHLQKLVPDARVDVGHGQMGERMLEKVMLRFLRKDTDVLICTTIIETGLDIPTANTMIIQDADRFGLSTLHQLRGRVGRYKHRAYCYLLLPQRRTVSPDAAKRLKAIEEFSDLGAGFQIAMRDLEIRGAGNILGREQSGHIASVGYELYCQLLEDAVSEMQGQPKPKRIAVHVELGVDAYIPRSYIASQRQRMEVYRRLVACKTPKDLKQVQKDLADAYGSAPKEIEVLLDLAEIRVLASQCGIDSIVRMDPDIVFTVSDVRKVDQVFQKAAGTVRMPDDHTIHWRLPKAYFEMPTLLRVLLKRLRDAK